jgi:Ca2+-transporting ATPase
LLKWQQKGTIGVVRGKKGVTQTISINKLVVGDVIVLEPGSIIPADCLLLEGNDVTVDEKFFTENEKAFKSVVAEDQLHGKDPFLFSSSIMLKGSGKALVCSVGVNSNRPKAVFDTNAKTALQERLNILAGVFKQYAIKASLIIFAASVVNLIVKAIINDKYTFDSILNDIVLYITQLIAVIIVVIPEGLSLVIVLSLAYSVTLMKNDGLLIKEIKSPEDNATINQILIGKTGTLTTGNLKVKKFWVHGQVKDNVRSDTLYNS